MKRNPIISLGIIFALWLALVLACRGGSQKGVSPSGDSRPPTGTAEITEETQYQGTARTTIKYIDVSGNVLGQQSYQDNVKVSVGPPHRSGQTVENNPINLSLGPVSAPTAEGQIEVHSANAITDTRDGRQVLLQYWSLTLSGGRISGTLSDTHAAEATVVNFLNASKELGPNLGTIVWPYPMSKNSTLQGTIARNEIRLRIEGNVSDGSRAFVSDIVATR
jgi:hypothetical protein